MKKSHSTQRPLSPQRRIPRISLRALRALRSNVVFSQAFQADATKEAVDATPPRARIFTELDRIDRFVTGPGCRMKAPRSRSSSPESGGLAMITLAEPTDLDALRLRTEFLSRPDLRVSGSHAAQLLGVRLCHAAALLESLAREGFLIRLDDGSYRCAPLPARPSVPATAQIAGSVQRPGTV